MKKVMNFLMLSCQKAAALIDKRSNVELTWKESFQLTMHKSMCEACSAYEKQSKLIDGILETQIKSEIETKQDIIENTSLKNKIISKL